MNQLRVYPECLPGKACVLRPQKYRQLKQRIPNVGKHMPENVIYLLKIVTHISIDVNQLLKIVAHFLKSINHFSKSVTHLLERANHFSKCVTHFYVFVLLHVKGRNDCESRV